MTASRPGDGSPAAGLYDIDPDTVAALVTSCPAVAGLSGGPFGAAATYLPGRKVPGIQITPGAVEVHVVGRYGTPVTELADQVRRALSGQVLGRKVDIVVEDLADPPRASLVTPAVVMPAPATGRPATAAGSTVGWPAADPLPPVVPR